MKIQLNHRQSEDSKNDSVNDMKVDGSHKLLKQNINFTTPPNFVFYGIFQKPSNDLQFKHSILFASTI